MAKKPPTEVPEKKKTDWEAATMAPVLTKREQELRDKFVTEYLKDYNSVKAAIRVGYGPSFAAEYAVKFIAEPYVQQQIHIREQNASEEDECDDKTDKLFVLRTLRALAKDSGNSTQSRIAALSKISEIKGFNAPVKKELTGPGGSPLNPTALHVYFSDDPDAE